MIAIEPSSAIHIARELAAANGMADRITVLPTKSTALSVPGVLAERAEVLVTETFASDLITEGDLADAPVRRRDEHEAKRRRRAGVAHGEPRALAAVGRRLHTQFGWRVVVHP